MAQRLHLGSVRLRQDNERKETPRTLDDDRWDLERMRWVDLDALTPDHRDMVQRAIASLEQRLQEAA